MENSISRTFVAVLFYGLFSSWEARAQTANDLPPAAIQCINERDEKVKKSLTEFEKQKAEIFDKYAVALEREVQKYRSTGDLDTLLAIMKELETAKKERKVSDAEIPELASYRSTLQTMLNGFERSKNLAVKEVDTQCLRKLTELRTSLTQAGNITSAQAVDQQIKSLESSGNFSVTPAKGDTKPGRSQNLLAEDKPLEGTIVLAPGSYSLTHRVMVGRREDVGGERKFYQGTLRTGQGVSLQNSGIFVVSGELEAKGTLFGHLLLETEAHGSMNLQKSLFDQCTFAKGGSLVSEYFSTKWIMEDSVFHGSFIRSWRVRHIGVQIRNCTFHEVEFAPIEYVADAGDEVKRDWLRIENCRFVNCKIPESLLIATNDCVFENCTFSQPTIQIPIKKPIRTTAYLKPTQRVELLTPMISLEIKDAALMNKRAGANISYELKGGELNF